MEKASRPPLLIYSALNIAVVLVLVFFAIQRRAWPCLSFAYYAELLCLLALFLLIPVGVFTARWCAPVAAAPKRSTRWFLRLSQVGLTVMWLWSGLSIGVVMMFAADSWPFSLPPSPDTTAARAGFAAIFGTEPTASVSRVYYGEENTRHGSTLIYLQFDVDDPTGLAELADAAGLIAYEPDTFIVPPPKLPSWWNMGFRHPASSLVFGPSASAQTRALWLPEGCTTVYYYDVRR